MSLGRRTTCALKHTLHYTRIFHHIAPLCLAPQISTRSNERRVLDANNLQNPIPSETNLSYRSNARLLQFLNQPFSAPAGCHRPPSPTDLDVAAAYLSIRASSPSPLNLHAPAYLRIAKHAAQSQLQQVMELLADDLLTHFVRDADPDGFSTAVVAVLSHATSGCPLTHKRTVELYHALMVSNMASPPVLHPNVLHRVLIAIMARPDTSLPPLESLAPALLSAEAQTERSSATSTSITYGLLMKILMEGEASYPRALDVFQQLIHSGRIPRLAQQRAESQGGSFKTIITGALVRGCLVFDWYERAVELLLEIFQDPRWPHAEGMTEADVQVMADLATEVLQTLISSSARGDILKCRRLIRAFLPTSSTPSPVQIPHDILFSFYDACYHHRLANTAASVYVHLQTPVIRAHHLYPPPRHSALIWLFDYLASPGVPPKIEGQRPTFKGHLPLARNLVDDVLQHGYPVPIVDRARFIALAAARGFGLYARQLWELFTAENDPDRDAVRGNAQMLVRVVSLFQKSQERWDSARALEAECANVTPKEVQASTTIADLSNTTADWDIAKGTRPNPKDALPRDFRQFAERVLASYIDTKQPLALASQQDLNALARAHLLLDHIPEGLEALTQIMSRGDAPDAKDINVAIAGIARYSSRRAARMIERMLERGINPTASTFGAVLHEALQDRDVQLVELLIGRARALGLGALTQKAMASLLRSTISFEWTADPEERLCQQRAVGQAMAAVEAAMRYPSREPGRKDHGKGHVLSVNMGKDCVKAALRAMQPKMAFRFWTMLVKDRVVADGKESRDMRAWIARAIRHEWRNKQLGYDKASEILDELGEGAVETDGPHVGKSSTAVDMTLKSAASVGP